MIDFELLRKIIDQHNSFILTTHVNPDADAIGSEIAMYYLLKRMNKKIAIINHNQTPYYLKFLDTENIIKKFNPAEHNKLFVEYEVIISLDLSTIDRIASLEETVRESKMVKVCIDHHDENCSFSDYAFCDSEYSSTAEIIFDFIKSENLFRIDKEIAIPIYAAVMTDTGSFVYEKTSPKTHRVAAELLEAGVVPRDIYKKIYEQVKYGRIKLLGKALSSISFNENKTIAWLTLKESDLQEADIDETDIDGFVNYTMKIDSVKIGMLFYELKDGFKVSYRSRGDIPVNKLASEFGGGGHLNAAGSKIVGKEMIDYIRVILNTAEKYLN
ncbi:MAG: bifunctional oligoribonuclease/PAP phosphatase NrnA [Ignavibacteriales bacterium]|nr:bifunctional oligoribonuclease/PAP phosphatase NrnA [Ignavibacteriales bacterium]